MSHVERDVQDFAIKLMGILRTDELYEAIGQFKAEVIARHSAESSPVVDLDRTAQALLDAADESYENLEAAKRILKRLRPSCRTKLERGTV